MKTLRRLFVAVALIFLSSSASAQLVGSSVTGTLQFGGSGPNYFDPANGFVPAGNLNVAGITVTISSSATEFGFNDGANLDLANFTNTQLIITDNVGSFGATSWRMTFTSNAFAGVSEVSDNFPGAGGVTATFVGNTITLNWGGTSTPGNYTATYNVSTTGTVPDGGSTALLLGLVLVLMSFVTRYVQPKLARVSIRG
jgi:hypothetical protein